MRELVSEVQVPGKNGYMGILPGHAPLLGLLGIGTLAYVSVSDGKKRYLSTHGGFVEVLDDHVRVLADCAERAEEIDIQRAKAALQRAPGRRIESRLGRRSGLRSSSPWRAPRPAWTRRNSTSSFLMPGARRRIGPLLRRADLGGAGIPRRRRGLRLPPLPTCSPRRSGLP